MSKKLGDVLVADRYRKRRRLWTSGHAEVLEAEDTVSGLSVTLKVISRQHQTGSVVDPRWDREARALFSIDSPFVVRCLARIDTADVVGMVTEPIKGMDLRAYLALNKPLELEVALRLAFQMAQGLHACHLAGTVHRDVRPENVMVTPDGIAMIVNLALASIEDATTLTMTGTMFGEPAYAAPETFSGSKLDARADIYSLGLIIWEMIAGESPFQGNGIVQILEEKSTRELPRVSSFESSVPSWLDDLVVAMVGRKPESRPSSLGQVVRSLAGRRRVFLEGSSRGNCIACGHRQLTSIQFCHFCGLSAKPDAGVDETSICVVEDAGDLEATVGFLQRSVSLKPRKPFRVALKRLPVALVQGVTPYQSGWLVTALEKRQCAVGFQEASQWYFKQTSVALILLSAAFMMLLTGPSIYLRAWHPMPSRLLGPGFTEFVFRQGFVYGFGKFLFVSVCVVGCVSIVKRRGLRLRGLPMLWFRGARLLALGRRDKNGAVGVAKGVALVIVIMAVMLTSAVILMNLALAVCRTYDLGAVTRFSSGGLARDFVAATLPTYLFGLALLLLFFRLAGRGGGPPLYPSGLTNQTHEVVLLPSLDLRFLELSRQISQSTDRDGVRFVLAETVESYLSFMKHRHNTDLLPAGPRRDLEERIQDAAESIVQNGGFLAELGASVSQEFKESMETLALRLRREVAERKGSDSDHVAVLLRDAEEQLVLWEADSDLFYRRLHALRTTSGELRAAIAQFAVISMELVDEESVRRELYVFSESLSALNGLLKREAVPA